MAKLFKNFAASTLLQSITASDTTIYIQTADANLFPTLGVGDTFKATIYDGTNQEIVNVTARSANALTVTRAQEFTTAYAFAAGARIRHGLTAADIQTALASATAVNFEGTPSGTNSYTVTLGASATIPSLARNERVTMLVPNTNTSAAAPTLTVTNGVDTTGSVAIRDVNGDIPEPGDLQAGYLVVLQWDEDNTYWRMTAPASRQLYAAQLNLGPFTENSVYNSQVRDWNLGTSFSTPASETEVCDNWQVEYDGTIGAFTFSRQTFTPGQTDVPDSPTYFARWDQSSAGSGSTYRRIKIPLKRRVEWRNGEKVTISVRAKADAARTVVPTLTQHFGTGGSPSSDVAAATGSWNLTTSWQQFTLSATLPSTSGKTLGSGNNDGLILYLALPLNVSMTIDVTNVQVESGDVVSRCADTSQLLYMSATQILNLLKTVDGAGSGLDADTLDGYNIGTSGGAIPLANGVNTWASAQTFNAAVAFNANVTISADLLFSADNARDIGANGATRPRTLYVGTSIEIGGVDATLARSGAGVLMVESDPISCRGATETLSGLKTFTGASLSLANNQPIIQFVESDANTDAKRFWITQTGGVFKLQFVNDSAAGPVDVISITRSGTTPVRTSITGALQARPPISTETSGTLTSASANCIVECSGGVTLPASVFTARDTVQLDAMGTNRTITRGSGLTMYLNGTDVASATLAAHGQGWAHYRTATVVILIGSFT